MSTFSIKMIIKKREIIYTDFQNESDAYNRNYLHCTEIDLQSNNLWLYEKIFEILHLYYIYLFHSKGRKKVLYLTYHVIVLCD